MLEFFEVCVGTTLYFLNLRVRGVRVEVPGHGGQPHLFPWPGAETWQRWGSTAPQHRSFQSNMLSVCCSFTSASALQVLQNGNRSALLAPMAAISALITCQQMHLQAPGCHNKYLGQHTGWVDAAPFAKVHIGLLALVAVPELSSSQPQLLRDRLLRCHVFWSASNAGQHTKTMNFVSRGFHL